MDGAKQTDPLRNQTWRIVGEAAISETGWPFIDGGCFLSGNEALLTSSTLKRSSEHEQQECEAQSIHRNDFDVPLVISCVLLFLSSRDNFFRSIGALISDSDR